MIKALALVACLYGLSLAEDNRCEILFSADKSYRDSLNAFAVKAMNGDVIHIYHEQEKRREFFNCKLIKVCDDSYYCIVNNYMATTDNLFNVIESGEIFYLDSIQKYYMK